MTREEYIDFANALKNNYTIDFDKLPEFCDMAISALSENKEEPTDEEVIEYCNKRGYVICSQIVIDDLKRRQHRIQLEGYVGVSGEEMKLNDKRSNAVQTQ